MELWIRSQDKGKLIKVNSVYLPSPTNANAFFPKIIANDGDYLGSYKTTKRALEVLNEIQEILIDYSKMDRVVYQMPKE